MIRSCWVDLNMLCSSGLPRHPGDPVWRTMMQHNPLKINAEKSRSGSPADPIRVRAKREIGRTRLRGIRVRENMAVLERHRSCSEHDRSRPRTRGKASTFLAGQPAEPDQSPVGPNSRVAKEHAVKFKTWCSLILTLLAVTIPAGAGNLLFVSDTTTDLDIPTVLTLDGHTVTVITNDYATGNTTLKSDLRGYDSVYWSTSQVVHDDPALLAILTDWVVAGGRLFVTGADGTYSSYNPTTMFLEFLGATDGWDGGYVLTPIADLPNSLTMGVVDVRGASPLTPGDSDSVCGPLASGTVGLTSPTTGSNPCAGGEAYGWTLRALGSGEIAWVESGNFSSTTPPDEPLWTDTNLSEWGAYNGAVRNFAAGLFFADGFESGDTSAWSVVVL